MGPQTILFAIESLLRLGETSYRIYVDKIKQADLPMPVADFEPPDNRKQILNYYRREIENYRDDPENYPATPSLLVIFYQLIDDYPDNDDVPDALADELKERYYLTDDYQQLIALKYKESAIIGNTDPALSEPAPGPLSPEVFASLYTISAGGKSSVQQISVLQRIGGTLVEIGVDYFSKSPDLLNVNSRKGLALKAFFSALDTVEFQQQHWLDGIEDLPKRFTVSLLESVSEAGNLFTEDLNVQRLITGTARALSNDVDDYFSNDPNKGRRQRAISLAETVFRSVVEHGGMIVANDPGGFFDIEDAAREDFVKNISQSLFKLLLDSPEGKLGAAFNRQALDTLVQSTFGSISRYPELIAKDRSDSVKKLIADISTELAKDDYSVNFSMAPALIRLVLEKSEQNLEALWPEDDAGQYLLMNATREVLDRLAKKPESGNWRLHLSRRELEDVLQLTLTEVAANPAWLTRKTAGKPYLAEALDTILEAVNKHGVRGISAKTGAELVKTGLQAAAARLDFLNRDQDDKIILGRIYDAVLGKILEDNPQQAAAAWQLARGEILTRLVEITLQELGKTKIDDDSLSRIEKVLKNEIERINNGAPLDFMQFADTLRKALNTDA